MKYIFRELTSTLVSLAVVGIVAYVIYRRLYGDTAALANKIPSLDQVTSSAWEIVKGGPSAVVSAVRGEGEDRYITDEEMRRRARELLALKTRQTVGF